MKIRNHQDFWAGLLFVGVGSLFVFGASGLEVGDSRQPGPAYFPLLLGGLMTVLGCLINFKAVTFETDDGTPIVSTDWRVMLSTFGAVLLAGALLPILGLWATVALMAVVLNVGAGRFALRAWLGVSLLAGLLCWMVFGQLLGQPLMLWPPQSG
ncbi:MAG: tripartite tricarboxylate transporter TctB family protein [Ideonella sp.]